MNKETLVWIAAVVIIGYLVGLHPGLIALLAGVVWGAMREKKEDANEEAE